MQVGEFFKHDNQELLLIESVPKLVKEKISQLKMSAIPFSMMFCFVKNKIFSFVT